MFQDGGKSNREFVSSLSFVKISVNFNAMGQSQRLSRSEKIEVTILILPLFSLINVKRILDERVSFVILKHNKTLSDNTHKEQNDKLFPNKVAIRLLDPKHSPHRKCHRRQYSSLNISARLLCRDQ